MNGSYCRLRADIMDIWRNDSALLDIEGVTNSNFVLFISFSVIPEHLSRFLHHIYLLTVEALRCAYDIEYHFTT